jgi:hypothetical protein
MLSRAYSMLARLLCAFVLGCPLLLGGFGCGGDDGPGETHIGDAGPEPDAGDPPLDAGPFDAGPPPPPRDVPDELQGQRCAVERDYIYELVTLSRPPEPTQLAVDAVSSRFAVGFVDSSTECLEALYLAQLEGASGIAPEITAAVDPCSTIEHVTVAHSAEKWLLGSIDSREDSRDLWAQTYDPDADRAGEGYRISDSPGGESEAMLAATTAGNAIAAWVEYDLASDSASLMARALDAEGKPRHDIVVLEDGVSGSFSGLTMSRVGPSLVALGYRSFDRDGRSELVLDVLDAETAERNREPWIVTTDGGANGSIDISGDDEGAGVIYSVIQGTSQQLWFQRLGPNALIQTSADTVGTAADAVRVIGPPYLAVDASIARVPAGFIVAYRALVGGEIQSPSIRVHFLDRFGRVIGQSGVALAGEFGGRTSVEAAYDGRVVVAWSDGSETSETTLFAVKLPCVGN